jgi:hypothetical protein
MTKFIASVARRLAECADYCDAMLQDTQQLQRTHAVEIEREMRSNMQRLARSFEHDHSARVMTMGQATKAARRDHERARIERNKQRALSRSAKHALLAD